MAASSTDSITFLTVEPPPAAGERGRSLLHRRAPPVPAHLRRRAGALRRHVRPGLLPARDRYVGLDWYPTSNLFVGASAAAAWVPYSVKAPESYGTAGASASGRSAGYSRLVEVPSRRPSSRGSLARWLLPAVDHIRLARPAGELSALTRTASDRESGAAQDHARSRHVDLRRPAESFTGRAPKEGCAAPSGHPSWGDLTPYQAT